MNRLSLRVLGCAVGMLLAVPLTAQEEGERNMDAVHCVSIRSIRDIQVVNDRTLVVRMQGGKVYRNDLPHRCPGLKRRDTLMYRSSIGQLCSLDVITVLEDWGGFGFRPGASCGLGMFEPITEEIAAELLESGG